MTLFEILRRRFVLLGWVGATLLLAGIVTTLLGVADPYPWHPFVSDVGQAGM